MFLLAETDPVELVSITTLITVCGGIATFFGGAIAVLWRIIEGSRKATETRAVTLETKNDALNTEMLTIKQDMGELKGRQLGIEQTCELAMKTVRDAVLERQTDVLRSNQKE